MYHNAYPHMHLGKCCGIYLSAAHTYINYQICPYVFKVSATEIASCGNMPADFMIWKHVLHYWSFGMGIHPSPVNSPVKDPVTRKSDIFFRLPKNEFNKLLICLWFDNMAVMWCIIGWYCNQRSYLKMPNVHVTINIISLLCQVWYHTVSANPLFDE